MSFKVGDKVITRFGGIGVITSVTGNNCYYGTLVQPIVADIDEGNGTLYTQYYFEDGKFTGNPNVWDISPYTKLHKALK